MVSLFFFIFLAELGLRATAYFSYASEFGHEKPVIHQSEVVPGKETKTILCIGDSFTWGGNGKRDQTYPAFLHQQLLIMDPDNNYVVINRGICEANTLRLVQKITAWINKYKPDTIVLLNGSANRFNPWDYRLWEKKSIWNSIHSHLANLRVVQVVRILYVNGVGQKLLSAVIPTYNPFIAWEIQKKKWQIKANIIILNDTLNLMWRALNDGDEEKAIELGLTALEENRGDGNIATTLAYSYLLRCNTVAAENIIEQVLPQFEDSETILNFKALYYKYMADQYLTKKIDYDRGIEYCLQGMEWDPDEIHYYYEITKYFDFQSRYTSRMIHDKLLAIAAQNPMVKQYKWFNDYLRIYQDKEAWEEGVREWITSDLNKIVETSKRMGVKVIVQNYPVDYPLANEVLREISELHMLGFVDNQKVFSELEPKEKYILDDDHCTALGHYVMANNIAEIILSTK